jgi:anti-sigma B factor antagonist
VGLEIDHHAEAGFHTLALSGELDLVGAPELRAMAGLLCVEATRGIRVDLSDVEFVDSAGLAALIMIHKLCAEHGYAYELVPGPPAVQRAFKIAGLLEPLPFPKA